MLTPLTLTLALTLAPGQAGTLKLTNDRPTHGYMGAPRADSKFLPGDVLFLAFDIENLKMDKEAKVQYRMGMEVTDSKGKSIFSRAPNDLELVNYLGGTRLPAFANIELPLTQEPGEYTLAVTVEDRLAKDTKQTLKHKFTVLKKDFGIVQLSTLTLVGSSGIPAPPILVEGQSIMVSFSTVGMALDPTKGVYFVFKARVLDDKGQPTNKEPLEGGVRGAAKEAPPIAQHQFALACNRVGKFTIEIDAEDKVTGKKAKVSFPMIVVDSMKK